MTLTQRTLTSNATVPGKGPPVSPSDLAWSLFLQGLRAARE